MIKLISGLTVLGLFILVALYAPLLASSKPIAMVYDGELYFPLFRYLFHRGFYTKNIDIFYNLLMFTAPLFFLFRKRRRVLVALVILQLSLFIFLVVRPPRDPAADPTLARLKHTSTQEATWAFDLKHMNTYAKLNLLLGKPHASSRPEYQADRGEWLKEERDKISFVLMPLLRPYHWQDDAGNLPNDHWWNQRRINGKDLAAALIFGVRISLVVGVTAVVLSLCIGIPLGAMAGYFGGKVDMFISRVIEVWEAMPTFFMLLMIVAILQSKSIFLVVAVLGIFGWTGMSRFLRGEVLKQRNLSYVEACRSIGFPNSRIILNHVIPNAIPPLLTLLPFSIMAAITSEAGLSFLGLGEEGSCSWGVLMDEGRTAFPGESALLWPAAIALTTLLVAIALVGDALRDRLDPKLKQ